MSEGRILGGRYRLASQLGAGGMGSVWCAHDLTLNAEVAVKLIDPELASSEEALARFRREAQAAAAIRSTYVVQILDYGIDGDDPFIAMELLKGEDLAHRIERVGRLSPDATAQIMGQAARALSLAHGNNIVHRDMKPENIFLVREEDEEVAKLLDFGIARHRGGLGDSGGLKTKTGAVLGTPYYMSPEQAIGQTADHLSDIWSFGVIACECLTGKRAFNSESLGGLFHAICMAPHPVPSQLGPVPEGFDAWFSRATDRDKSKRYQTIRQAADDLRSLCGRVSAQPAGISSSDCPGQSPAIVRSDEPFVALKPAAVSAFEYTAPPASHSIPGLPHHSTRTLASVSMVVAAAILVGVYFGWQWLMHSAETGPTASATLGVPDAALAAPPAVTSAAENIGAKPVGTTHEAATSGPVLLLEHAAAATTAAKTRPAIPSPRAAASVAYPRPGVSNLPQTDTGGSQPPASAKKRHTDSSGI